MTNQFASILSEHGVSSGADLHDTITAFDYEICGVMFDEDSPFSLELSETRRQPENLECLLSCSMRVEPQWSLENASRALVGIWNQWLSVQNPRLEIIERHVGTDSALVRVLTISHSEGGACTIEFKLDKGLPDA